LSWLKILLCNFFFFKILWIATVFSHIVFLFYFFYFSKLYLSIFFYIELIDNLVFVIFFFKTLFIATMFLCMVCFCFCFFIIFSKIIFFLFYFLILNWLKITVTICEENTVTFLANYCGLLQCFFLYSFFSVLLCFSLKISLSILFFKY
jgi:hypothetical protein